MKNAYPNPIVPGFNPDPSVVHVDGVYYLVTSSFEYLPALPIYRSYDLKEWSLIGHVATRPEQVSVEQVPTRAGVYAPTIRWRDGMFYVIVTVAMSPKGCVVFQSADPAGPWSDGLTLPGIHGIDPDLAWDENGSAYVTYSAYGLSAAQSFVHLGIQQAKVDLETGELLEVPRSVWSGTGMKAAEAPHIYQRGDWWYLIIAEGGTESGHSVSVARGRSIEGPFQGFANNPVLTARSTDRAVQCTGHADLVHTGDDWTAAVMLGTRQAGSSAASPLGRETYITSVSWADDWPVLEPVALCLSEQTFDERFALQDGNSLDDPGWLGVRAHPARLGRPGPSGLLISSTQGLSSPHPAFIGRRQRHFNVSLSTTVDAAKGTGGLAARYDENAWFCIEVDSQGETTTVTAKASLPGITQEWRTQFKKGLVKLLIEVTAPPPGSGILSRGEHIWLIAQQGDEVAKLAKLHGPHWSMEACRSFTGRTLGMFASDGEVAFTEWHYRGFDSGAPSPTRANIA